jgi:hypothetical protein
MNNKKNRKHQAWIHTHTHTHTHTYAERERERERTFTVVFTGRTGKMKVRRFRIANF